MKINVKGRVKNMIAQVASGIECEAGDTIVHFFHGTNHGSVRLSEGELRRIVAANAPYDPQARRAFFDSLRDFADQVHPPRTL